MAIDLSSITAAVGNSTNVWLMTQETLASLTQETINEFLQANLFVRNINSVFFDADYQEKRKKADERSMELLRSWLTPEQLSDYDKKGYFVVRGSVTGARYMINSPVQAYNVGELDDNDEVVMRLCFVPKGTAAVGDIILAQKIMLETDELAAKAVANKMHPSHSWFGRTTE